MTNEETHIWTYELLDISKYEAIHRSRNRQVDEQTDEHAGGLGWGFMLKCMDVL
jgi:hypothetical protein